MNNAQIINEIIEQQGLKNANINNLLKSQFEQIFNDGKINLATILNEILHLEDSSNETNNKPHEEPKGVLTGYWHKHYTVSENILRNIKNQIKTKEFKKQAKEKELLIKKEGKDFATIAAELTEFNVDYA